MFFIQRGIVGILDEDEKSVRKVLEAGQHFGAVSYISFDYR